MDTSGHIAVLGAGYVGLTTGSCLSALGHTVACVDHDVALVNSLRAGQVTIAEPDLPRLLRTGLAAGTLAFDTDIDAAVAAAHTIIICLPTPSGSDGSTDLTAITDTLIHISSQARRGAVVVVKSTVPVGTNTSLASALGRPDISVVSNPEFLREGHAVYDFLHPDRIVIGSHDPAAAEAVANIYDSIRTEVIHTDPASAELAKLAANAFLATKVSFVNDIATFCDSVSADISDIAAILGADPRIGNDYLRPGPGWGGPCLPKDTTALAHQARTAGVSLPVIDAAINANTGRQRHVLSTVASELGELRGARIGILGLAFKSGTNDHRQSPAANIARALAEHGAEIIACDPLVEPAAGGLRLTRDPYDAARHADAMLLLTDWEEYRRIDWPRVAAAMTGNLVVDTRNFLDPREVHEAGLRHVGLGSMNRRAAAKHAAAQSDRPDHTCRSAKRSTAAPAA